MSYRMCVTRGWCKTDEASSWIWFSFMSALLPLQLSLNLSLDAHSYLLYTTRIQQMPHYKGPMQLFYHNSKRTSKETGACFCAQVPWRAFWPRRESSSKKCFSHMILQHVDDNDSARTATWFDLVIRQYTRHYPERTLLQEILFYDSKVNDGWIDLMVKDTDWQCGSFSEAIRYNVQLGWYPIDLHVLISPSTMIQYKQSLLWMDHVTSLSSCFRRWPSKEYGTGHTSARFTRLFQSTFIGPGMSMMDGWMQIKCRNISALVSLSSARRMDHVTWTRWRTDGEVIVYFTTTLQHIQHALSDFSTVKHVCRKCKVSMLY